MLDGKLVPQTSPLLGIIKETGLEGTKVEFLIQQFTPFYSEAEKLVAKAETIKVVDETSLEAMAEAGIIRKQLQRIRIESDKVRYALKEDSRKEGNAIQGIYNKLIEITGPVEERLEKDEKFLEIREAEKKAAKLLDRVERLSQYVADVSLYNLKDMADEIFDELFKDCKDKFEKEQARLVKEEEDRVALEKKNAEEAEKTRIENKKLKKENEEKDRKIQKAAEEKKKLEDKIAADKLAEEKKIKDAEDAEKAKIKVLEDTKLAAIKAPDKDKLNTLAKDIDLIMMPRVTSEEALEITKKVQKMLNSISDFVKEKAKNL
jgi:hypothetical protein